MTSRDPATTTDYAAATEALTDEQILALRDEAAAAGDDLACSICHAALRGDANARRAVAVMIADAAAMQPR